MINITAQIDSELEAIAGKHGPFAASLALNRTAVGARDAVRRNLPNRFRLRNQWTMRGIRATASNKQNLTAKVLAPGYMQIQEDGGRRTPQLHRMLAAPTPAVQSSGVIPKSKRPRALIAQGKAFVMRTRGGNAGVFQRRRRQIRMLYALSPTQDYDERFHFADDIGEHVSQEFGHNFREALAHALATARR